MYWPITHMVAPKDKAMGCSECHAKGGRLEGIDGVYLPGRGDVNPWITQGGWLLALLTLLGVLGHGFLRIIARNQH
jgi:hypothetical protein